MKNRKTKGEMKEMHRKNVFKAIVALAVALAFVMPVTAFANVGTIGVTSNSENTDDIKNMVESTTNTDNSDTGETTVDNSESAVLSRGVVYVDDDALEEWYDETHVHTITEGINNATEGDTVFVYNGVYPEAITINKQLTLMGQSRDGVIISPSGTWNNVIYVYKSGGLSGVNISRLTVQAPDQRHCIYYRYVTGGTIENCNLSGPRNEVVYFYHAVDISVINCNIHNSERESGIKIQYSDGCNIEGCNIYDNDEEGIYFTSSFNNNIVTGCNIYGNGYNGILIDGGYPYPSGNNITGCTIYNNDDFGISIEDALNCKLENNIINDGFNVEGSSVDYFDHDIGPSNLINGEPIYWLYEEVGTTYDGIDFGFLGMISCTDVTVMNADTCGILLVNTTHSTISNVNSHDAGYGVNFQLDSTNINFTNCNFYNVGGGVSLISSSSCSTYNNFTNCKAYDFDVTGFSIQKSNNNIFKNCSAYHLGPTTGFGFRITMASENTLINCSAYNNSWGFSVSNSYQGVVVNNSIIDCYAYNNTQDGIEIACSGSYAMSAKTTVTGCNIYGNGDDGIYIWSLYDNIITNNSIYNNNGGIYIRESPHNVLDDNIMNGNTYSFYIDATTDLNDFTQYISPSNTIDGRHIYYLIDQHDIVLDASYNAGFLGLVSCSNITLLDADVTGVLIADITDSTISNVDVHNSMDGMYMYSSSGNVIVNCDVYNNEDFGIHFRSCLANDIINCNVYNNGDDGIFFEYASNNNNIESCDSYDNAYAIYFDTSSGNTVTDCNLYNCSQGMYFKSSNNNVITNCDIYHNSRGLNFGNYNTGNIFTDCNICDNSQYGIRITSSSDKNNVFYHNNFANNGQYRDSASNTYDNGYPSGGNYWDDYTGVDLFHGPNQDIPGSDGIGDEPYIVYGSNKDNYPFMNPIDDITPIITDIQAAPEVQTSNESVNITCTVTDNWDMVKTVKVFITGPEGFALNTTMNEESENNYYYDSIYTTTGVYYYHIWADDTSGNIVESETYTFAIMEYFTISAVDPLPLWKKTVPFTISATVYNTTGVVNVTLWYRYSPDKTTWTNWTVYGICEEPIPQWFWSFTGVDGYYEFYSIAIDDYGNVEDKPSTADSSTGIDTVKPVTTIELTGTMGENDWYTSSVTVTLTATDALSGIESTWYKLCLLYTSPSPRD